MNFTFFINYNSTVTQVYPLNWLECTLVDEPENGQVFYRRKFQGALTFGPGRIEVTIESGVNVVSHICEDYTVFNDIRVADPFARIDLLILNGTGIYYEGYFSISQGEWDFDNKLFTITPLTTDDYVSWVEDGDIQYNILVLAAVNTIYSDGSTVTNYTRTRLLKTVIEYLVQQVFGVAYTWLSGKIQSTFFNNAINPITGVTNRYNCLTIAQKSDILRPLSSNPATKGMLSFNDLMEILKCINLRWTFDIIFDIFTIEHISYWDAVPEIDIRTQELAIASNKFKYIKEDLPKYERFYWMEAYNDDFVGEPIYYDSLGVNQDSKSNVSEFYLPVTTDIEYIRNCISVSEESKISDDGWVLFATEYRLPDYYIYMNNGILQPGTVYLNCDMSWGRLHNAFFKHERQLITGYMNRALTTFYSAIKSKQQEVSIIYCNSFNPNNYITSELGETYFGGEKGDIVKATIKPYGEINLTVNYGPATGAIVPIPNIKTIRIVETGSCGHLFAVLSEPADANLEILLGYEVLDHLGIAIPDCNEGNVNSWIIPIGSYTDNYTISFDASGCGGGIPVGGCWNYTWDTSDAVAHGWTVFNIIRDPNCEC